MDAEFVVRKRPVDDFYSRAFFWLSIIGSLLVAYSLWLPWRVADADETFGKRFTERKVYSLLYSGKKGKPLMWNELAKLTCDKFSDMEIGSRYSDIAQTIITRLPEIRKEKGYHEIGGSYFGCTHWDKCKEHVGERCMAYYALRWTGTGCYYLIIFALCCVTGALCFQAAESTAEDVRQVMMYQYEAWVMALFASAQAVVATLFWIKVSNSYLEDLQKTAYYPYPQLSYGAVTVLLGDLLLVTAAGFARLQCRRTQKEYLQNYTFPALPSQVNWFGKQPSPFPQTLRTPQDVAVIGGGLAGMISAYYLAKRGLQVTVFERNDRTGAETSYGPAGVTMWKNVKRGLKWNGTVDVTAGGFKGFVEYAEGALWTILDPDPSRPALMLEARNALNEFLADNPDAQPIIHDKGLLYVLDEDLFNKNREEFADDPSMIFYTKAEFEKSEWFSPMFEDCNYYGILWSKEEGAIDPHRFVVFLAQKVVSMGGKVHVNSAVARLEEADKTGKVLIHITDRGPPRAFDAAIVTVGAMSHPGDLMKASGIQDPVDEVYGAKGYSVTGRMPEGFLKMGFVDAVDTKFIRPWTDKEGNFCIRVGSIADPFDPEDPLAIHWDRMDEFKQNQFSKKLFDANIDTEGVFRADTTYDAVVESGKLEVWTGIRPCNRHGRVPLIRLAKGTTRIVLVSGFGSNGYVMCWNAGPRVAKMLDDLLGR